MKRRFEGENCSVAQALARLGDGWTMLIIREAFVGTRRFADFEQVLGISKNVLTDRLRQLVLDGILETVDAGEYGTRLEYQLTAQGKDLITIVTALRQWGDRWIFGDGAAPLLVCDRRTGRPIPRLRLRDESGAPLRGRDIALRPGPGATASTRGRFPDSAQ